MIDARGLPPRVGARPNNHQSNNFQRSDPKQSKSSLPRTTESPKPNPGKPEPHQPTRIATQLHPSANDGATIRLLPSSHPGIGKFLRVFPKKGGIFDRRLKNAHIISAALPTAVGPSLRSSGWQAGQAKRLRNARRITMSFRTRRPLRGLQEPGPATQHSAGVPSSMCLGRVPCPRPGCCSIAQVMPPLPV